MGASANNAAAEDEIEGRALGVIKSRVNRASNGRAEMLTVNSGADFYQVVDWRATMDAASKYAPL